MPVNIYPASTDYFKAVQFPAQAFTLESLRAAEFASDGLGLPTLAMGTSAVVFHAAVDEAPRALRCFIRSDASSRERYAALGEFLGTHDLKPHVTATTWIDAAIQVNGASWPVLQMEWIDGQALDHYVGVLAGNSDAAGLAMLADRWREMIAVLQGAEFAHGDLQHGNVLVDRDGQLRLVDFDGVWIPALASGPAPTESGHRNYQHPQHNGAIAWGRWLDTFSALVIYLALVALSKDQGLWQFYNADNLLFQKADFVSPDQTRIWNQLNELGDSEITLLARRLADCCNTGWVAAKSLERTIEQPWWEKHGPPPVSPGSKRLAPPEQETQPKSPGQPLHDAAASAGDEPWWGQVTHPGGSVTRTGGQVTAAGPAKAAAIVVAFVLVVLGAGLAAVTHGVSAFLIVVGLVSGTWGWKRRNNSRGSNPRPPKR